MATMLEKAQNFFADEVNDYVFYSELAKQQKNAKLKKHLIRIAKMERAHSTFWAAFIESRGGTVKDPKIRKRRIWCMKFLGKIVGPRPVVYFSEVGEKSGKVIYHDFLVRHKKELTRKELVRLQSIIVDEISHESFFQEESKKLPNENIRDAVLGMNDGLVEILGSVAGFAAVYPNNPFLVGVSGLIVGVAGSLSMGIGNFIAVRSQRQVDEAKREELSILLDVNPKQAAKELQGRLEDADLPPEIIAKVQAKIAAVKPKENHSKPFEKSRSGGEVKAGLITAVSYLIGVAFPVTPFFLFATSFISLPFAFLFAGIALVIVSSFLSLVSHLSLRNKIVEMIVAAFGAAGLSYLFGKTMQIVTGIGA